MSSKVYGHRDQRASACDDAAEPRWADDMSSLHACACRNIACATRKLIGGREREGDSAREGRDERQADRQDER